MIVVFREINNDFLTFNNSNNIVIPAGTYMIHYAKLTESEWNNGDRFNGSTELVGELEKNGEYYELKEGARVQLVCPMYNEYDRVDPHTLKLTVIITEAKTGRSSEN